MASIGQCDVLWQCYWQYLLMRHLTEPTLRVVNISGSATGAVN
jgi:hypothetical protein